MVKFYNHIPSDLQEWALKQSIFFVASAPLTGSHINCSPKGRPSATLTILNENLVGYMDASGSGVETISHVYENGRVTLMFCSFDRSPRIMRWFCRGRVVETGHAEYAMWVKRMGKAEYPGMRAVVILDVFKGCTFRFFDELDLLGLNWETEALIEMINSTNFLWLRSATPL